MWKVLFSEYLIKRPWLTVRRDKLQLSTGKIIPEYYVLEYPDWVNVTAITKEGQIVMERQYRHGAGSTNYEIPSGVMEKGETPLEAAQRELLEETGYAAMAFAAARSIDKEFRKDCIWIPIAGYAAATAVGIERIASDRHHWYDVVAGAAVGYGAAELTWWLSDLMFGKGSNVSVGTSGNTVDVVYNF